MKGNLLETIYQLNCLSYKFHNVYILLRKSILNRHDLILKKPVETH